MASGDGAQQVDAPPYTLDQLLDDRSRELYQTLHAYRPIRLGRATARGFECRILEDHVEINPSHTIRPVPLFAHELLHVRLYQQGFNFVSYRNADAEMIDVLHNTFAHLKFFDEFLSLGYDPREFFHESDGNSAHKNLKDAVRRLDSNEQRGKVPTRDIALAYLSAHHPAGRPSSADRTQLKVLKRLAEPGAFPRLKRFLEWWASAEPCQVPELYARFFALWGRLDASFKVLNAHPEAPEEFHAADFATA